MFEKDRPRSHHCRSGRAAVVHRRAENWLQNCNFSW